MPLSGGLNYTILMVICMVIGVVMWYPFIKIADKKEYELELEAGAGKRRSRNESRKNHQCRSRSIMKGKSMWTLSIDIGGTYIKSALIMDTQIREKRRIRDTKNR